MSMKTIVAAQPRLKITVPIKHNGTVYTQSKTCVTAKSATHFYVGVKHVYYYRWLEQATGRLTRLTLAAFLEFADISPGLKMFLSWKIGSRRDTRLLSRSLTSC